MFAATTTAPRRRRPSSRAATLKISAVSLVAAVAITVGLAVQMAGGHDPALGSGTKPSQVMRPPSATQSQSQTPTPAPAPVVTSTS
jgi:hypothetical protein